MTILNKLKFKTATTTKEKDQIAALHLEQQDHPGDAEADQGAPNKAGRPHQTDLEDRVAKCHRYGRNICVKYWKVGVKSVSLRIFVELH